jgi:transcriptional regulator with XRE-family HTH domain
VKRTARMFPNEQLRRERQRRGWSREYVAEQIGIADSKTIGRWERGVAFPSSYFLQKLCTLFDMPAQYLGLYQEERAVGTALAIELVLDCDVQRYFNDGVLWVELGPRPDAPDLLRRWGTLLGFSAAEMTNLTNEEVLARATRSAIGGRRMLLVINGL